MDAKEAILNQFSAALNMLRRAIELCPESLWLEGSPNRFWHLAYHALFYTHFYLSPSEAEFVPWAKSRLEYNFLSSVPWRPKEPHQPDTPYTQAELLEYAGFCLEQVAAQTANLDPTAPSGFHWLPFTKLELQLYNLRHLSHHTGQLAGRLRTSANIGLPWIR